MSEPVVHVALRLLEIEALPADLEGEARARLPRRDAVTRGSLIALVRHHYSNYDELCRVFQFRPADYAAFKAAVNRRIAKRITTQEKIA